MDDIYVTYVDNHDYDDTDDDHDSNNDINARACNARVPLVSILAPGTLSIPRGAP